MITEQHTQEGLSRSYIQALAGVAGVNLSAEREFDYGFDGSFRGVSLRDKRRVENGFPLDFQLKCTKNWKHQGTDVLYSLETKTYNDLVSRDPAGVGAILILLCLPKEPSEWLFVSEDFLRIQKCCYYKRLEGNIVTNEKSKKQIRIPRANVLTGDVIRSVLADERTRRIGGGA